VEAALDALSPRIPLIAVKCGARGAIVQQGAQRITVPSVPGAPVDTIGAGDTFNAGFLAAWLHGANIAVSARAGNIAGALSTLRPGGTEAFRDGSLRQDFLRQHEFPFPEAEPQL
jgi:sugar/nucleoside kinase (ribokinase family)